jgi:hypothetical protein
VLASSSRFTAPTAPLPRLRARSAIYAASLFAALAVLLVSAVSARAACESSNLTQPFSKWGDANYYELAPGGGFEGAAAEWDASGWTLGGSTHRAPGSEPYAATGALGQWSLALPAGSSGQSPYMCVDTERPTFRFFARNRGLLSAVVVQVVYRTLLGPIALPLGAVALSGAWEPTLPMLTGSVAGELLSGGTAEVALRFTELTGESEIDDVYVDPRMR